MSEWLKEHAWKATSATLTKRQRNISLRKRFNDLRLHDAPRCDAVNTGVRRRVEPTLHSSVFSYSAKDFNSLASTSSVIIPPARPLPVNPPK